MAKKTTTKTSTKKKSSDVNLDNIREYNLVDDKIIEPGEGGESSFPESIKAKKISHFDIIDFIFKDIDSFNNLTDTVLKQNFFMLNRTFSIKYPLQANAFNIMGVNMADATRVWLAFMRGREGTGKIPSFIYTKGAAKTAQMNAMEAAAGLDKKLVADYCRRYSLSSRDFRDMIEFFPEQTVADVKNFEKKQKSSEMGFKKISKNAED